MIVTDERALICDLAETYHVFDYKSLPVFLVATLSVGLREDSRIKMKMNGAKAPYDKIVLSLIADRLGAVLSAWTGSKHEQTMLTPILLGLDTQENKSDVVAFDTPEAFEEARKKILQEGGS